MEYPGHVIRMGEEDGDLVKAVKQRLNTLLGAASDAGVRLAEDDPNFGPKMQQMVRLFQARNVDAEGRPLRQDGEIGSLTWVALFGQDSVQGGDTAADTLLARVLEIAALQEAKPVREIPVNSNRGPEVDAYLRRAGATPGLSWCCAFVYWCFDEAARSTGRTNPMVRTAGCLDHWRRASGAGARRIAAAAAVDNPALVKPGMIFVMDHGRGLGHTGLIEKVNGGLLTTIEGNTDASRTREGGGVYRLTRKVGEVNAGYIDYSGA